MPRIYLSPSTQEFNPYITSGNEEYWMNLIADAMIPYLQQYGIDYSRNTPEMTAGSSIRESNAGNYDFHVAIHSNASGAAGQEGNQRGTVIFYYPSSTNGLRMAELISQQFKEIYPNPERVIITPTTSLGEVSRTSAPSVLIEVAFHDNVEDANWITNNIDPIAKSIADAINQYFTSSAGAATGQTGRVNLTSGYLNIRSGPSLNSPVTGMAPNGATLRILGRSGDWYNIEYNGQNGFVSSNYVVLQ